MNSNYNNPLMTKT